MGCDKCEQDPCTCAPRSTTPIRSTFTLQPPGITKEQFGVTLFEAIKTQAALKQCLRNADMYGHKKKLALEQQEHDKAMALSKALQILLKHPSLTLDDVARILAIP